MFFNSFLSSIEKPLRFSPTLFIPLYSTGEPAAKINGGTSWVTKAPAPMKACLLMLQN